MSIFQLNSSFVFSYRSFIVGGVLLTFAIQSCRTDSNPALAVVPTPIPAKVNKLTCLTDQLDLCQLLSEDTLYQLMIRDSSSNEIGMIDSINRESHLVDNLPQLNTCSYEWPGSRMDTLFGDNWKLPYQVTNELGIGEIQYFGAQDDSDLKAQKAFTRLYSNVGLEQADSIRHLMLQDSVFVSDSTYLDLNVSLSYVERYEPMLSIGERAVWDKLSQKLVVLESSIIFKVRADVYSDEDKNKQLSVEVAKRVLNHCR
ncbi:MAG: hypothetical protein ABIV51_09925 [Saprospiraceae bacterium]